MNDGHGHTTFTWQVRMKCMDFREEDHEIVLCDYRAARRHNQLKDILFWRVVCDECQILRTSTSDIAEECAKIPSFRRFMLSGTPLVSSIEDLHEELHFLGIVPFAVKDDKFWKENIGIPWIRQKQKCLSLLRLLMEATCMRHVKSQRRSRRIEYINDAIVSGPPGSRLLRLPPLVVEWRGVDLKIAEEKYVYGQLEGLCRKVMIMMDRKRDDLMNRAMVIASAPRSSSTPSSSSSSSSASHMNTTTANGGARCSSVGVADMGMDPQNDGDDRDDGDDGDGGGGSTSEGSAGGGVATRRGKKRSLELDVDIFSHPHSHETLLSLVKVHPQLRREWRDLDQCMTLLRVIASVMVKMIAQPSNEHRITLDSTLRILRTALESRSSSSSSSARDDLGGESLTAHWYYD